MRILGVETRREGHEAKPIELTCQLARENGHETIFVKSIDEAVIQLSSQSFDYILMHHMGFEGVRRLRSINNNARYVGFSSNVLPESAAPPGSMNYDGKMRMLKEYDQVIGTDDIVKFAEDLSSSGE